MKKRFSLRFLSWLIVVVMLCSYYTPVSAAISENADESQRLSYEKVEPDTIGIVRLGEVDKDEGIGEQTDFKNSDKVRISILLDKPSTLEAGFSSEKIFKNIRAMLYRKTLIENQEEMISDIEQRLGGRLDVSWNLTLAANLISVNVEYGKINDIKKIPGVKQVVVETKYEPCTEEDEYQPAMCTSNNMIGMSAAYEAGYTGAGARIAVIDTGIDMGHQSFSESGFEYGLSELDSYPDLMDKIDINSVLNQLNVFQKDNRLTADNLYKTKKIPFGYNYVDATYEYLGHDKDGKTEHGSHVAGIAAANAYIPDGQEGFVKALDTVKVQGVAPDAQLIVMKVFGKEGGAYDSDYMAAIEDAIMLDADSINLSLGSAAAGFTQNKVYKKMLEHLAKSNAVVVLSAGNSSNWSAYTNGDNPGYLYGEDINFNTVGSPGSHTNSFTVASVDNVDNSGEANKNYTMSSFSSWGVSGSLELKPEITAPGGNIYSVNGYHMGKSGYEGGSDQYELMSGTSMAAPQISGMSAIVSQYIDTNGLEEKTHLSNRTLVQSLLMSTANPLTVDDSRYYPVFQQGAGLANIGNAINAKSYITMMSNATKSYADGKVKAELGDDPERKGEYTFNFELNNLTDEEQKYYLRGDLFTQSLLELNGESYLDTATSMLLGDVEWKSDGKILNTNEKIKKMDFNGDGLVNAEDAQAILDYSIKIREDLHNEDYADLNNDGEINTYDAYLLLKNINFGLVSLLPNGKVEIQVTIKLTESQKEELNKNYVNGAYIEGFVFAEQVDGTSSVHSIPVLGYYGNWSEPSMFDHGTYAERFNGDESKSYLGVEDTNSLIFRHSGETNSWYVVGNPYMIEEEYPKDRVAVRSSDIFIGEKISLIRNASSVMLLIRNQDNKCVYKGDVSKENYGAYYNKTYNQWFNSLKQFILGKQLSTLGVKEDETLKIQIVAVPEYYEMDNELDANGIINLIDSGKLSKGASFTTNMIVDDTAPALIDVKKNLLNGDLNITAKDNNYIATLQIIGEDNEVYEKILPHQTEKGQTVNVNFSLDGKEIGKYCYVMIGDYAGNETVYKIKYDGAGKNYVGKLYGFTNSDARGSNAMRWMEVDPGKVWLMTKSIYGGTINQEQMKSSVTAGEYVGGFVYMASDDGYMYVANQSSRNQTYRLESYKSVTSTILDMAFNYKDGKLYALCSDNIICTVDLITGQLTKVYSITVKNPVNNYGNYQKLIHLAIDDNGNFYSSNYGLVNSVFLYKWNLDDITEDKITDLAPASLKNETIGYTSWNGSMAWDHDNDILYMCNGISKGSNSTYLLKVDVNSGIAYRANTDYAGENDPSEYASRIFNTLTGMYIVPKKSIDIPISDQSSYIELDRHEQNGMVGNSIELDYEIKPWNLKDKSVIWTTTNPQVVSVEDGLVSMVGEGTATVTVTTVAEPYLSDSCTFIVRNIDAVNLSAFVDAGNSSKGWADFNTGSLNELSIVSKSDKTIKGGTLLDGMLYAHDGNNILKVDPETFETTELGILEEKYLWSDAAPAPVTEDGYFGKIIALSNNGENISIIDPSAQQIRSDRQAGYIGNQPMAAIAYIGSGIYKTSSTSTKGYPAVYYYIITENGDLWHYTIYASGTAYMYVREKLGNVDIKLTDVSLVVADQHASMIYDENNRCLFLSYYIEGDSAQLCAIDPETLLVSNLGNFSKNTRPVVSLYQYNRISELTVQMISYEKTMYLENPKTFKARVLPINYKNEVTWSSSNNDIATVDENGIVNPLKEGKVTITATSVAMDSQGKQATCSCEVNVKKLAKINTKINAQITTEEGPYWATIDTSNVTATKNAKSSVQFTGAGAHDGKIYGTYDDGSTKWPLYCIDPENEYSETTGALMPYKFAIRDLTTAPADKLETIDKNGDPITLNTFGKPIYLGYYQGVYMLNDFATGKRSGFSMTSMLEFCGIAYNGDTEYIDENNVSHDCKSFMALYSDGTLYNMAMYGEYTSLRADNLLYKMVLTPVGNVGMTFDNPTDITMTYVNDSNIEGLIVGVSHNPVELYYIDLKADSLSCDLIGILPEASAISGIYTNNDIFANKVNLKYNADTIVVQEEIDDVDDNLNDSVVRNSLQCYGSLNSVSVNSSSEVTDDEKTVTVEVTAKDEDGRDAASTNGLISVDYDKDALELQSVNVHADYKSVKEADGNVKIAYAQTEEIAAGASVATLTFAVKSDSDTAVKVTTEQLNNEKPGYCEEVAVKFADKTTVLEKVYGDSRYSTAAAVSQHGWDSSEYAVIASGEAYVDALVSAPLAAVYNAPVLITEADELSKETSAELERLGVKTVFIAGGTGVVSEKVEQELADRNMAVKRFAGADRYETSLMIAQYIDKVTAGGVNKAYVVGGEAEADAVSIASKAAKEKQPILLTDRDEIDADTMAWLKAEKLDTAYVIGGEGVVSNVVLDSLNKVTAEDISGNRVYGEDRYATNAAVVSRFYVQDAENYEAEKVFVTKGVTIIDALVAAPYAAQTDSPIVIVDEELCQAQREVLAKVASLHLVQVGGGVSEAAVSEMIELLSR